MVVESGTTEGACEGNDRKVAEDARSCGRDEEKETAKSPLASARILIEVWSFRLLTGSKIFCICGPLAKPCSAIALVDAIPQAA